MAAEQVERDTDGRFTGAKRPWLELKPGETEGQKQERLFHTCYACGAYIVDSAALDAHEATHR